MPVECLFLVLAFGALRGVPARKGSEQRSASEGKTCPSKIKL